MKRSRLFPYILLLSLLSHGGPSLAQFVTFGPAHQLSKREDLNPESWSRQTDTATIPFWDDFSKGIQTSKWISKGASYTETIGNKAPSIGMVLFNGVDEAGKSYSLQEKDQGEGDFLTSIPLDLSEIAAAQQSTVYLSFFWQAGGKAEVPDSNDRLTLQILTPSNIWLTIWEKRGGPTVDRNRFIQESIPIRPEWQHANFQFRFFSNGRQSGPFDSWLLDYIYLNIRRSSTNLSYPDRALTQGNTVRLGDFGAYPWELLQKNQKGKWSTAKSEFQNLENRFKAMEYSVTLRDSSGVILLPINSTTPLNPVPNALERRTIVSRSFTEIPLPAKPTEVIFEMALITGDGFLSEINGSDTIRYSQVDFRSNDRVSSRFALRDYFAYDQGVADYTAGINQRSGQLAVKYTSPEPVFLKGISIDFSSARQVNQVLDLVVWSALDKKPLYSKEVVIPEKIPGQELHYFKLEEEIAVSGTFFVGFTQFTNDFLQVGLDKGNDFGDRIFYNVGGGWVQNTEVAGSLLIHPHVSLTGKARGSIETTTSLRIYPNPTVSEVQVEGEFSSLQVLDSFGRKVFPSRIASDKGEVLNFKDQRPGLYLIYVQGNSGLQSYRIFVKK
ncbi:MAG: T9SS type A sorting domain-containing protein [Bacteroidetes bacterium]|nr:T9SS type A sorting domain-containing protein [Bacteroidota bacterium]